jgi:hypothetical protein
MTNLKTKPFSIIQPIPTTEIQRCNNNEIFASCILQNKIQKHPSSNLAVEGRCCCCNCCCNLPPTASCNKQNKNKKLLKRKKSTPQTKTPHSKTFDILSDLGVLGKLYEATHTVLDQGFSVNRIRLKLGHHCIDGFVFFKYSFMYNLCSFAVFQRFLHDV